MLDRIGPLLFGPQYKPSLARALGVNKRTLERWVRDGYCPEDKLDLAYTLLAERRAAIAALQHDMMMTLYPEETAP